MAPADGRDMIREIAPDFYWIQECGIRDGGRIGRSVGPDTPWFTPGDEVHGGQNAYLFADDRSLLFDTLCPLSAARIVEVLQELLDGRGLDFLALSHPDVPHAGNTAAILEAYPDATLVAPRYGTGHELYRLGDARRVGEGDALDLGRYTVAFHEATFLDAAVHMWMTERRTDTLFTVDWLGYPHTDAECLRFGDEFDAPLTADRFRRFHEQVVPWLRFVDADKVAAEIDHLVARYDPSWLAPAHGNPIREHATEHLRTMTGVVRSIAGSGGAG